MNEMVAVLMLFLLVGCADSPSTRANAVTAAAYEAQILDCVDRAHSLDESHACRCEVMKRYGRACPAGWEK